MRRRRLKNCRPGLFLWTHDAGTSGAFDVLGFKTEYRTENASGWICDAYVVASGEYFWGGARSNEARENMVVTEVTYAEAMQALEAAGIEGDR